MDRAKAKTFSYLAGSKHLPFSFFKESFLFALCQNHWLFVKVLDRQAGISGRFGDGSEVLGATKKFALTL